MVQVSWFKENSCPIPNAFSKFQGYNQYMQQRHRAPNVTAEKLEQLCQNLAKAVGFPSMNTTRHNKFCAELDALLDTFTKYKERLESDNQRHKHHAWDKCNGQQCVE